MKNINTFEEFVNEAFRPAADEKLIDKMKIRDGWELNVVEVSEDTEHIVITGEYATSTTDGDTVWIPKDQWNEFKKMINGINV
jgi:hypothetical protein